MNTALTAEVLPAIVDPMLRPRLRQYIDRDESPARGAAVWRRDVEARAIGDGLLGWSAEAAPMQCRVPDVWEAA